MNGTDIKEKWTVSFLKRNGAMWSSNFDDKQGAMDFLLENVDDYPHIVISRHELYRN